MRTRRSAAVAAASFLLLTGAAIAAPCAYAGTPGATHASDRNSDFNDDGYEDVLIGAPGGTVGGKKGAGYVTVQYGSSSGIGTKRSAVFSQSTSGVAGAAEAGDGFGRAVATGDLDADGYDDAIIGISGEDIGTAADAGGITVLWGGASGLYGGNSVWLEPEEPAAGEKFGGALAAGRFSSDSPGDQLAVLDRDDLDVYRYDTSPRLQSVPLERRSRSPLSSAAEERDILPKSLTTGDYDNNGLADLVVGGVTVGAEPGHGWSVFLSGQPEGLVFERQLRGGPVVASGDIDGDGYDDLVTGEPKSPDDGGETMTGGLVGVYHGSADGPLGVDGADSPPRWWTQGSAGIPGTPERGDGWGTDLSVADTDGDGYADVAIGAAGEDIGTLADAGAVWVLRGAAGGLTATGVRSWDQNSTNVPGSAEAGDRWGGQVKLTDPNRDGRFGLLASAPGENTGDGAVWVLSAGPGGVTATGSWSYGGGSLSAPAPDAAYGASIDE
ncbi:FG-GAP repeat protein [Streptomyces sp. NPDC048560]|uniref:FG-GAP repeat protein n=1 Tax=Streptomyces sp. NPDC048560 TaxID=3155488 RepID=UPI003439E04A